VVVAVLIALTDFRAGFLAVDFRPTRVTVARLTFLVDLADFRAGFLAGRVVAEARLTIPFFAVLFLGTGLLLTAFRAFFATAVPVSPMAVPAVTAKSLAPSKPALAVSRTTAPVSTARSLAPSNPALAVSKTTAPVLTTADVTVLRMPSLSVSIAAPFRIDSIFAFRTNRGKGE
jgi:hypothetical protein